MSVRLELLLNNVVRPVYFVEVVKQEKAGPDRCVFKARRDLSINVGDDVKVRTVEATPTYLFAGRVYEKEVEYGVQKVTALSYGARMDEVRVFPTRFYVNRSPEFIAQDLVTSLLGLSWGSSWSSGVTISRYEALGTVGENLRRLAKIAGADFWVRTDSSGVTRFYFEPASLSNLNVSLKLSGAGGNARLEQYNPAGTEIVNAVEVYGRTGTVNETYELWETSAGVSAFYLAKPALSRGVSVRDISLAEGVDFTYDPLDATYKQPVIRLGTPVSGTSTNPTRAVFSLQMDGTEWAYAEDSTSIVAYGKRMKAFIVDNESVRTDLQQVANKIVQLFKDPRATMKVVIGTIRKDVRDGGYVSVTMSELGFSNTPFVVRKVRWVYPPGVTELELGQFAPELYDFEKQYPDLVETASRSVVATTQKYLARRLYMSGDGSSTYPYLLVFGLRDAIHSSAGLLAVGAGFEQAWFTLDLQIIGAYTRTYTRVGTARAPASSAKQVIRGSAINSLVTDYLSNPVFLNANAANEITIRAQVFVELNLGGTRFRVAPSPGDGTRYFTITVSGVKRILPTTLGWVASVRADVGSGGSGDVFLYWGQSASFMAVEGTHIFNVGFETV